MALTAADQKRLLAQLQEDEGFAAYPYQDRGGFTIGYGRNLTARGISPAEALMLLQNDVAADDPLILDRWPWAQYLDPPRYAVLANMAYNLGVTGLAGFTKMLDALLRSDYDSAAEEMRRSTWASQVGGRAERLARQMQTGRWE